MSTVHGIVEMLSKCSDIFVNVETTFETETLLDFVIIFHLSEASVLFHYVHVFDYCVSKLDIKLIRHINFNKTM